MAKAKAKFSHSEGQAKTRYETLKPARSEVLRQAREASRLTLPGLIPEEGATDPHSIAEQPWTSSGARYVNNLSAKVLLSQFPPQRSFFKLDVEPEVAAELGGKAGETEAVLAGISRDAMALMDESASRTIWMEAIRHLVVAGNVLVYQPDDGMQMRMWRLDQFVALRGRDGLIQEAVAVDHILPSELSEEDRKACDIEYDPEDPKTNKKVEVYTHVYVRDGTMFHYEEINKKLRPGSEGSVDKDAAGWQFLRWQAVPGSDYGRSYVSEYAGDFLSLADASKSIIKFAIEAARILRIVDPNSGIDIEELAYAESGDFLTGIRDRISTLQLDKSADFNIVWNLAEKIEARLSQAFLLTSDAIRDAERVTATEIRAISQELEDSLGGTYTVLSAEVQRPYAKRLLHILKKTKKTPTLKELDGVSLSIVTGFNALGANHEIASMREWLMDLKEVFGPQWLAENIDGSEVAVRMGTGHGISDVLKLLRSPDEVAQDQQNAALTEAGVKAAPQLAQGMMNSMEQLNPEDMEGAINGEI